MIELTLHVGMGKTGTSSIQAALKENADQLRDQGVEYLGMWFGGISSDFIGYDGQEKFFSSSESEMIENADRLVSYLETCKAERGVDKFILSNESMFGNVKNLAPFVVRLMESINVKIVAYARNPGDWLPSAYNQWAIYHKNIEGPIPDYEVTARSLIKVYGGLLIWAEKFPRNFYLRFFRKSMNVVSDFSETCGVGITASQDRKLERASFSESVLRAIYNDQFTGKVLPHRFNCAVGRAKAFPAPRLEEIVDKKFNYQATESVVQENKEIFQKLHSLTGVDINEGSYKVPVKPDIDNLRSELNDSLAQIVMNQAERILNLEKRIKRLEHGGQ